MNSQPLNQYRPKWRQENGNQAPSDGVTRVRWKAQVRRSSVSPKRKALLAKAVKVMPLLADVEASKARPMTAEEIATILCQQGTQCNRYEVAHAIRSVDEDESRVRRYPGANAAVAMRYSLK